MKTIFDESTRAELLNRMMLLNGNSTAQWGRMNVGQMLKHCTIWNAWVQGRDNTLPYKQTLLGRLFGKLALKSSVKDETPMKRNMPAGTGFTVKEKVDDVEGYKEKWRAGIMAYAHFSNPAFVHDFFGKMTDEEIGVFAYKHIDHHLRQFGC